MFIKSLFGIVRETAFAGYKFVNLAYTAKHHWNLYAWVFVLFQQQPGHDFLHISPFVAGPEMF